MLESPPASPSFAEALRVWVRVAVHSFGGPAGQIAVMHRILVDEKRWISEERFLHALNYCMLLPGPEAQQLATYIGWLLHGTRGGLAAGTLFVLPGFLSLLVLSCLYALYRGMGLVDALFYGIKPAVLAVVVEAVVRIGKRALKGPAFLALAAAAFLAIFLFDVPFPLIVLGAGLVGLGVRSSSTGPVGSQGAADRALDEEAAHTRPSTGRALRVLAVYLPLWWGPLLALYLLAGAQSVFFQEGIFFSKVAVVTFGGAYAVLAYTAQEAVNTFGWLKPGEMLDGLGLAETTPGPLISVLQFVGFLGAYRNPGDLPPLLAGVLASLLTTWVTYVPCFLWIFLGAPYVEALRGSRRLAGALSAITAAVVGVILNLAAWFSLHTLFATVDEVRALGMRLLVPRWETLDPAALVLALAAMVAMLRFHVGMLPTMGASAVAGALIYALGHS